MPQVLKTGSKNLNKENWEFYHPNGKHMFTGGEKKAEWYLKHLDAKGNPLAVIIGEKKVQLTFIPKGNGFNDGEVFGLSGREVRCVVTDDTEGLQRHHIVPYCYRSHFPVQYKTKNHHDVVLVTYKIHEQYETEASKYKNELAKEYGVKNLNELNLEYTKILCNYSNDKIKVLSKFNSIFTSYNRIPQDVIVDNLKSVAELTGIPFKQISTFNYIQLYKLYLHLKKIHDNDLKKVKNESKIKYDHGYHLVQKLDTHEKLEAFVRRWRQHFLDTMNPEYMPVGWNVNYRCRVEM